MTKSNENVGIQFIKGENEKQHPEIRLFRSQDGNKGQAIYKFDNPKTITIENFKSIKKMHLIDEEGVLSTKKIDLSISGNRVLQVNSTYNWGSEKEFERFMRFASRHAKVLTSN